MIFKTYNQNKEIVTLSISSKKKISKSSNKHKKKAFCYKQKK